MGELTFEETIHDFRKEIDACIKKAEGYIGGKEVTSDFHSKYVREMFLVRTKLQEAKMWLGKVLEVTGSPFPPEYADNTENMQPPESYIQETGVGEDGYIPDK